MSAEQGGTPPFSVEHLEGMYTRHADKIKACHDKGKAVPEEHWDEEIALLEGTAEPAPVFAQLADGRSIQLKVRFSIIEQVAYERTLLKMKKLSEAPQDDHSEELANYVLELVAMATYNPKITAEYLETHPDVFSNEDIQDIMEVWKQERGVYNQRIQSFRDKRSRDRESRAAPVAGDDMASVVSPGT